MTEVPGYWRHETSGAVRTAVEAYLNGGEMTPDQIAAMRAYLRQWIADPCWVGPTVPELRRRIDYLTSRDALRHWLLDALSWGIDPI